MNTAQNNPFKQDMVRMAVPLGMSTNLSVGGFNLSADEDRCVEVPSKLVPALRDHGLIEAPEVPINNRPAQVKR